MRASTVASEAIFNRADSAVRIRSPVITIASCLVDAVQVGRNHTISEYLHSAICNCSS